MVKKKNMEEKQMAKSTATEQTKIRKEKLLLRTKNTRNFTTPIFQNAGIRTHTINLSFTVWDCQKIPDGM